MATRTLPALRADPARALVLALLAAYALAATLTIPQHWYMEDAGGYWSAALRLRAGAYVAWFEEHC